MGSSMPVLAELIAMAGSSEVIVDDCDGLTVEN
jgi:hypothetical protein